EYFVLLTQPTKRSLIQIEHEELLQIAIKIQKDKYHEQLFCELFKKFKEQEAAKFGFETHSRKYEELFEKSIDQIKDKIRPAIYKLIQNYYEKYFYVAHMWVGKVSSFEHYLKELVRMVGSGVDLKAQLHREQTEFNEILKKRKKLIEQLKIKGSYLALFDGFGDFMVTKIYRRFAQIYAVYKIEYILWEVARRLELTLMQVRCLLARELVEALKTGKFNKSELAARTKFFVHYVEKGKEKIFIGKKAKQLTETTSRIVEKVAEIQGQTGCVAMPKGL
ncbi:MAG: hypothetical protein AB1465_07410, partial [Patescibacteria group bacterium]